ncbi:MAG: RNA polymerase sigma factor [Gammaproteobacteria bacterium]
MEILPVRLMETPESASVQSDQPQGVPESTLEGADPVADNQRAFVVLLFTKYRGALLRHVERLVRSREDAAELVQETYLRVMHQVQASRFEAAARAYLFQTATNLARDHFRRQRFRAHDRIDELSDADLPLGCPPPDQVVADDEVLGRLRAAILELPPVTRAVFIKARVQNLGYVTIARELGLSTRTVERRMAEAMEMLCSRIRDAQ